MQQESNQHTDYHKYTINCGPREYRNEINLGKVQAVCQQIDCEEQNRHLVECFPFEYIITKQTNDVNDHPVNKGRRVTERRADGILYSHTVFDQEELRITGIGVELPGEREHWKIIHHFQWVIDPGFYGTDAIQLWPTYRDSKGWLSASEVTGQVLYNDGEQVYTSAYFSLGEETYTSNSIFWGKQTSTDIFGEFSMLRSGENKRGYVSYTVQEAQDGWIVDAWINFTHQITWFQYPAITAKQKHMTAGASDTHAFQTIQDALQFFPDTEERKALNGSSGE